MSIKKLVQTGEDKDGVFNVMDGLSFARTINNNADELGTETKLDLEIYNTPEAIAKALKEQSGKTGFHTPGGPDDLPTFEEEGAPVDSPSKQEGGIAQIYNEALEGEDYPEITLYSGKHYNQIKFLEKIDMNKIQNMPNISIDEGYYNGVDKETGKPIFVFSKEFINLNTLSSISWNSIQSNYKILETNIDIYAGMEDTTESKYSQFHESFGAEMSKEVYFNDKLVEEMGDKLVTPENYIGEGWYYTVVRANESSKFEFGILKLDVELNAELKKDAKYVLNISLLSDEGGTDLDELDMTGIVKSIDAYIPEPESEPVILKVGDSCKLTFKNKYDEDTVNEWANKLLNGEFTNSKVSIEDSSNLIVNADGASEGGYVLFKTTNSPEDAYTYLPLSMREIHEGNGIDVTEFTESGWYKPEFIETESGEAIKLIKVSNLPELTLNNITSIKIDGEEVEEADISDYIANKE